jgi:hypothetical protein
VDWLTFLAQVIGSLAWPVTIVIVVLLLKNQIASLFPVLKRLKAGPVEAEFERGIEEAKTEAAGLPAPEALPAPLDARRQQLIQIAYINPRTAILDAWQGVEFAVKKAAIQRIGGSPMPDVSSALRMIRELAKASLISQDDVALFHDLRGLRNQATHAADFNPTLASALNYIDLAVGLQTKFEQLAGIG